MPASQYPTLSNMPPGCLTSTPWETSSTPVHAPYFDVDEKVIMQESLVKGYARPLFVGDAAFDKDAEGTSVGYDSQAEREARTFWIGEANRRRGNTAQYHASARDGIVSLANRVRDLLIHVGEIYGKYKEGGSVTYKLKNPGRSGGTGSFPLSMHDSTISGSIEGGGASSGDRTGPGRGHGTGVLMMLREQDREAIRSSYHEALHLLWCANYGANQSIAWKENKRIYDAARGAEGPGMGMGPTSPARTPVIPLIPNAPLPTGPAGFSPSGPTPTGPAGVSPSEPTPAGLEPSEVDEESVETEVAEEESVAPAKKKSGNGMLIVGAAALGLLMLTRK